MPIKPPPPDYSHLPPGKPKTEEDQDWYHREVINPLPGKPEGTRQYFKAKVRHKKLLAAIERVEPLARQMEYKLLSSMTNGPAKKVLSQLMKEEDKAEAEAAAQAEAAAAAAGVSLDMIKAQKIITNKTALDLSGNSLSATSSFGINAIILVGSLLQHCESLSALKLRDCSLNADEIGVICSSLKTNTSIRIVDLSKNNIQCPGMQHVTDLLELNSSLTSVNLSSCKCAEILENEGECNEKSRSDITGVAKLAKVLYGNKSLKFINLSKNKLGSEGKEVIGLELLRSELSRIEFINTDGWSIKRKDTTFNVANCQLGKSDAFLMAGLLKINQRLLHVDLSGNRIGPDGTKMVSRALVNNKSITHLDLSMNSLGENYTFPDWRADLSGLAELTTVLLHNTRLTSLNLGDNALTGIAHSDDVACLDGICACFGALISNCHITSLDLSRNELTGVTHYPQLDALEALAVLLQQNSTLTRLDISHNNLGIWPDQDGCKVLSHALERNLSLVTLRLEGNLIAEAEMSLLASALHSVHVRGSVLAMALADNDLADETMADMSVCFEECISF